MSDLFDSSNEMHNDPLTSDVADRLLDGDNESLELADLSALLSEIRDVPGSTPTPVVNGALAEFVSVDFVTTAAPLTAGATTMSSLETGDVVAGTTRRKRMFTSIAAFCGTLTGKVVVGGTLAAASVTGAHASGVVDVPILPDRIVQVETVDVELTDQVIERDDKPDAVGFVDDEAERDAEERDEKERDEKERDEKERDEKERDEKERDEKERDEKERDEKERDEKERDEKERDEKKRDEHVHDEAPAPEPKPKPDPKPDPKPEPVSDVERIIDELEEQLHRDKNAVREEATALIKPLEEQREEVEAAKAAALAPVNEEWGGYIESILADIEATDDEAELAELEEYLDYKYGLWEEAQADVIAEFTPTLNNIEEQLTNIELERDAELERLYGIFLEEVEALQAG